MAVLQSADTLVQLCRYDPGTVRCQSTGNGEITGTTGTAEAAAVDPFGAIPVGTGHTAINRDFIYFLTKLLL